MTEFTIIELDSGLRRYPLPQVSENNVVWNHTVRGQEDKILLFDKNKTVEIQDANKGFSPKTSGKNIVWIGLDIHGSEQIFFYDGKETIQISRNEHPFIGSFQISGDNIVWTTKPTNRSPEDCISCPVVYNEFNSESLFLYNGEQTILLSGNNTDNSFPQVSGDNVVWVSRASNSDSEIFFYNGKETIQITNDNAYHSSPKVSENNVVWVSNGNVYLYNGRKTIQLDDKKRIVHDSSLQISGDNVVWAAYYSDRSSIVEDDAIFFYNGKKTIKLSDDGRTTLSPQISGKNIVWSSGYGGKEGRGEIFFYNENENEIIQITNDNLIDIDPQINGNRIVWQRKHYYQAKPFFYSVMLATFDDTESSSTPISHNKHESIDLLALLMFSLISIYLLNKLIKKRWIKL